jgi:hypothetical protein
MEQEYENELREKKLITGIAKAKQYADKKEWRYARNAITLPWSNVVLPATQNSKIADSLFQYYSIFVDSIDAVEARQRDSIAAIEARQRDSIVAIEARQRIISAAGRYHAEKIVVTTGPPYFDTKGEPFLNITIYFSLFKSGNFRFVIRSFGYRDPYRTRLENYGEGTFTVDEYNYITFVEKNSSYLENYPNGGQQGSNHSKWLIGNNPYDLRAPTANSGFVFFKEK